jgi:hypothetical protein
MYGWPGKIIFGNSQTISYQTEWIRFLARSFLHSTKYKKVMNDLFDILNEVEYSSTLEGQFANLLMDFFSYDMHKNWRNAFRPKCIR